MRFWLSRETPIPIREQLSAQLLLGILSRRLAPGERLPSVRDLARRLHIHANTVSAVYQDLAARGWVSQKHGSGVFVCAGRFGETESSVEQFVRGCIDEGVARGFTREALLDSFAAIRRNAVTHKFVVIDPDIEFARIVAAEIREAVGSSVPFFSADNMLGIEGELDTDTCVLVSSAHASRIAESLFLRNFRCIELKAMQDVVAGQMRPASHALIGVASRSESILRWSSTLLSALGFAPDVVVQRDARQPNWRDGLAACDIVATDVITSAELPENIRPVVFRIVSESFLKDLRRVTAEQVS
ncbi:MAG TPA: GntR family transcriptional regulator [Bryobacteraceae bacterium]|nr:GntR family transcriptional regulator [Bryobacteraceae bacterium]